jgi:regulator of sigma E protease
MAKKFGVEVEEFGLGYPPRLFGKKKGGTLYSLNLLPFGAFVRISEEKLREKPIWQRILVLLGGIVSFWIVSFVLITIVFWLGVSFQVSDEEDGHLINPQVQIVAVLSDSPAEQAGLKAGDIIIKVKSQSSKAKDIDKIRQVQDFTKEHKGEEITLTIQRDEEIFEVNLIPRVSPPQGQGALGVALTRLATKKYSLAGALFQGFLTTFKLTGQIVFAFGQMVKKLVAREPVGGELVGPVGIFDIFIKAGNLGVVYFLQTVALISLHIAVINALPFPVADGGKLLFLALEKIRKKPLNERTEQGINMAFFALLLALMLWVTIKDINRLF